MYELFNKYREQIEKDLIFNENTVQEFTMRLPGIKHFWVGKLVQAKIDSKRLEDKKKELLKDIQSGVKPAIGLSQASLNNIAQSHETIKQINEKLEEYKIIIEYLEKVEKILHSTSYDVKSFIDTIKINEVR